MRAGPAPRIRHGADYDPRIAVPRLLSDTCHGVERPVSTMMSCMKKGVPMNVTSNTGSGTR